MKNIFKLFLPASWLLLAVTTASGKETITSRLEINIINECTARDTSDVVLGNMQLIFLPYNNDGGVGDKKSWDSKKRDLGLLDILPSVWLCNEGLVFKGTRRIDGMEYEILDEGEASVQNGALTIIPGRTQTVSLTYLPSGTYRLVLSVGDESVAAEFER